MWQVTLVSSKKDTAVCTYLADLSLEAFLRLFEPLLSLLSSGDLLLFGLPRDLDNPEPDLPPNPLFPIGWRLTSLKWLGRGCGLRLTEKIFAWSVLNVYPKNCDRYSWLKLFRRKHYNLTSDTSLWFPCRKKWDSGPPCIWWKNTSIFFTSFRWRWVSI